MGALQRYPDYSDSGISWVGEIPSHWQVKPTFVVAGEESIKNSDGKETTVLSLSYGRVIVKDVEKNFGLLPESFETYQLVFNGDIILRLTDLQNDKRSLRVGLSKHQGIITSAYLKLVCKRKELLPSFAYRLLHSYDTTKVFYGMGGGLRQSMKFSDFRRLPLLVPPVAEQTQIINFLDCETAKIDRLIEKQQRLIELLEEKRQAVISHVVTKGLNPDAPMKDSGAEWLGEVPEHWVIKNYRYAARIYRGKFGHRPRNDPDFYDGPYPFIQTGDIAQADKKITHFKQTLNERGISVSQKFPSGALVMAIAANIGDTAILDFEAYAPDSVVGFKPKNNIDLEFLRYSLMAALQELEKTSTQSSQANLNIDRIGSVKAAFPPIKEQMEIVSMLDNLNHKYERVKLNALSGIELLKERRTALISAAVTGKIDVRECIISPASEAADIALAEQASL